MAAVTAYYNEHDPHAAAWLRNLIAEGHIAPGEVDERSILDVRPADLAGFKQCHFFAGIGVWSYALRQAGWDDSREIWTGSCPCQPFSAAGKGDGFADERHLWPAFFWLIEQCRPARIMGEQVASKDGLAWLDLVLSDLEGADYAAGAVDLGAAGVGAPHIRQRLWFVAHAVQPGRAEGRPGAGDGSAAGGGGLVGLADTDKQCSEHTQQCAGEQGPRRQCPPAERGGGAGGLADASGDGFQGTEPVDPANRGRRSADEGGAAGQPGRPGPTNGHWRNADWLRCRDGKWRPVEPGTSPLASGIAGRVGRLRAYGNALCAPAAVEVIAAMMDVLP